MMSYRNGTYVAFNGCGTTDPTESDIKYFNLLKAWKENDNFDFTFSNSHEKTSQVSDESSLETLKRRLQERFRNSKNMLLIITENSSNNRGLLNWEIEQAVTVYKLPIIVAYTNYERIGNPSKLSDFWPKTLYKFITENKVKVIHIGFKKEIIFSAINQFDINNFPKTALSYYSKEVYEKYGIN